jgi:hypothetical protein
MLLLLMFVVLFSSIDVVFVFFESIHPLIVIIAIVNTNTKPMIFSCPHIFFNNIFIFFMI